MDAKTTDCTIPEIDNGLAVIYRRLNNIRDNLHDGIHGETPTTEDSDKSEISTPSLSSISTRIDDITNVISTIENYTNKIHQSSNQEKVG